MMKLDERIEINGDVGTIRTCDRLLRRQILWIYKKSSSVISLYLSAFSALIIFPIFYFNFPTIHKIRGANVGQNHNWFFESKTNPILTNILTLKISESKFNIFENFGGSNGETFYRY